MNKYFKHQNEDGEMVREKYLTDEETFLVGYLKSFDRARTKEWSNRGLWKVAQQSD